MIIGRMGHAGIRGIHVMGTGTSCSQGLGHMVGAHRTVAEG